MQPTINKIKPVNLFRDQTIFRPIEANNFPNWAFSDMMQERKEQIFLTGQYTTKTLTDWLSGKPKEPGWYDTKDSGQSSIDNMYPLSDSVLKTKQIAGRSYWNGKYWSRCFVYWEFLSNYSTTALMEECKNTRAVDNRGYVLHHKYIQYRGIKPN